MSYYEIKFLIQKRGEYFQFNYWHHLYSNRCISSRKLSSNEIARQKLRGVALWSGCKAAGLFPQQQQQTAITYFSAKF